MERETGFEPATSTLARSHSTTELLPQCLHFFSLCQEICQPPGDGLKAMMETERLLIEEWRPEDWLRFRPIATDPAVMRYISTGQPWPDERIQQFVAKQINQAQTDGFCLWKLVEKSTQRLVGQCGLQPLGQTGEIEIGWWLARDYWGRGLATEAARRVLQYAFETLHLKRIIAIAQPANQASIKVMQKLGMSFERATSHEELGLANPEIEIVLYSIENREATT